MPDKALVERGYKGKIYQTHAAATRDLMRIGGKDVEGTYVVVGPGGDRRAVARQPPVARSSRSTSCTKYEKAYGPGSRNQFAGARLRRHDRAARRSCPVALKKAQARHAGVPRRAARRAGDAWAARRVSHGVLNWTAHDHWGYTNETGVMLKVVNGDWKVE